MGKTVLNTALWVSKISVCAMVLAVAAAVPIHDLDGPVKPREVAGISVVSEGPAIPLVETVEKVSAEPRRIVAKPIIKNEIKEIEPASISKKDLRSKLAPKPFMSHPERSQASGSITPNSHGIFNTVELEFSDSYKVKAWASVSVQLRADQQSIVQCLNNASFCQSETLSRWARDIESARQQPLMVMIDQVNMLANQISYKSDYAAFGRSDLWAAPNVFLERGGDCEDYALLKFATLSALGVKEHNMRIVVGKLMDGTPHAVLTVKIAGDELVLDNRSNRIVSASYGDFSPKYSMNFEKRWSHFKRKEPALYAQMSPR